MTTILKSLAAASLAALLSTTALAETINFGIISTESQSNLRTTWEPLLEDMTEQTGLDIKPFFASDYAGIIEAMRFDKVQVAWYGNKAAMEAVDRADGEVFVQTVAASGEAGYYGLILAPSESPLTSVDDLLKCDKTLDFGIGDPNSTSGFLVPMTFVFAAKGVDPKECFANVTNANHETNAMAVANDQVDAAANNTESYALIEKNNPEAFKNTKVIWKSPLIPADPIVWRKDLDAAAKEKLKTFFLDYGTERSKGNIEEEKAVLAALEWAPFRESTDAQLLPIRVMELTKSIATLEADTAMEAGAKKAEIDKLTAERSKFEAQIASGS